MYKSYIRNAKKRSQRGDKGRETFEPEEGQQYGVVKDMMGNGRLMALCEDGQKRMARIRGSMRKFKSKVIIKSGDLVVLAMRDFEVDKADVVHKFSHEEVSALMYRNELPERIVKSLTESEWNTGAGLTDDYVMFAHESNGRPDDADSNIKEEDELDVDGI
jgi:translation initiation factor 1A